MAKTYNLAQLRHRHQHCISWIDIWNDLVSGDLSQDHYEKHKQRIGPACSEPTDAVCAAPSVSDQWIFSELEKGNDQPDS